MSETGVTGIYSFDPKFYTQDNALFLTNRSGNQLMRNQIQRGYLSARGINHVVFDSEGAVVTTKDTAGVAGPASNPGNGRLHFMWNPSDIQKVYTASVGVGPTAVDKSQNKISLPSQSRFQFEMVFDRQLEINTRGAASQGLESLDVVGQGAGIVGPQGQTADGADLVPVLSPRIIGALHDLQIFERITNIQAAGGIGGTTIAFPWIDVYFSPRLMLGGYIEDATTVYMKFSHDYIPTVLKITLTMLIQYSGVAVASSLPTDTTSPTLTPTGQIDPNSVIKPTVTKVNTNPNPPVLTAYEGFAPVGRHVWGAPHADLLDTKPAATVPLNDIVIHHTGGGHISASSSVAALRGIDAAATKDDGYAIVYNYMVGIDGTVYEARGDRKSAATLNANDFTLAICALGNYELEDPTPALLQGIQNTISWLVTAGRINAGATIHKHLEYFATACPGASLIPYVNSGFFQAVPLTSLPKTKTPV